MQAWKYELYRQLVEPFDLEITVCHYPTGTSKWNPIEHRFFSEISKRWAGQPLDSYESLTDSRPAIRFHSAALV